MFLKVGDKAPVFEQPDQNLKMRNLNEFASENLVLVFFPGAFTSVCTKELCTFRDSMTNFNKLNARVLGISIDSPFSLAAFAKQNNLNFDLLSDFDRIVSKTYGGIHNDFAKIKGFTVSKRAVFIVGKDGTIKYVWISEDPGKEPDYKEIEEKLSTLK